MKFSKSAQARFVNPSLRKRPKTSAANNVVGVTIFVAVLVLAFQFGVYIGENRITRTTTSPPHWTEYNILELEQHFKCDEAYATARPIWTADQWREIRDLYQEFSKVNQEGTHQIAKDRTFDSSEFAVPFQAGKVKGRGLMAARDIAEGEIILRSSNNTIAFTDGLTYRKFLFAMEERFPSFGCDVMNWNWVQDLDDEGEAFGIVVELNDDNLLNTEDEETAANLHCGTPGEEDSCDMKDLKFYSAREIRKGEELVGSYGEFVSYHSWDEFGL